MELTAAEPELSEFSTVPEPRHFDAGSAIHIFATPAPVRKMMQLYCTCGSMALDT
jgi:hypothetical protein